MSEKRCTQCGEVKPLTEFAKQDDRADGRASYCLTCKAKAQATRAATLTAEERNQQQAAKRAGMRKNKCAICHTAIDGEGICVTCEECVEVMGGLEGLKRAVRAVRFLTKAE